MMSSLETFGSKLEVNTYYRPESSGVIYSNMAAIRSAASRASTILKSPITIRQSPPLVKPVALRPSGPVFISRSYATESPAAVEAPDYLDEGERKIFDTIKQELQPVKLEVCGI